MGIQQSKLKRMVACGKGSNKTKKKKEIYFEEERNKQIYSDSESGENTLNSDNRKEVNTILLKKMTEKPKTKKKKKKKKKPKKKEEDYFTELQEEYYKKKNAKEETKLKRNRSGSFNEEKKIVWREGEILGSGSFGTVLWGFNETKGIQMAVKKVYLGESNDIAEKVAALEQEMKLLKKLNHKNVVKYYGSEKKYDSLNIFLEYVEMIQKYAPLSEQLIRLYTKQILKGLEYLHSHQLIHRDIKAANVLVDRKGVCKLSDFGTAKMIFGMDEKLNSLKGTVNWMAPEVIKQSGYGRYADIWSVGCTVYEMLTGGPPWSDIPSMYELMSIVVSGDMLPELPDDISYECRDFIECCLRREPHDRLNVYELLQHPFLENTEEEDVYLKEEIEKDMEEKAKKREKRRESVDFQNYLAILRKDKGGKLYSKKNQNQLNQMKKEKKKPRIRLKIPKVQDEFESDDDFSFDDDFEPSTPSKKNHLKLKLNSTNRELLLVLKDRTPKKKRRKKKKKKASRNSKSPFKSKRFKRPKIQEINEDLYRLEGTRLKKNNSSKSSQVPTRKKFLNRNQKRLRKPRKKEGAKITLKYEDEGSNFFLKVDQDDSIFYEEEDEFDMFDHDEEMRDSVESISSTRKTKGMTAEEGLNKTNSMDSKNYLKIEKKSSGCTVGGSSFRSTPVKTFVGEDQDEEFRSQNSPTKFESEEEIRFNEGVNTVGRKKKKKKFFDKKSFSKENEFG